MAPKPRSLRFDKLARIYDDEVLPVFAERFGRMLMRGMVLPDKCQVLDVACGTGYPAVDIVRKMGEGSRLIAIDASSAMLDVARRKMQELGAKGVFFRTESADPKLSFTADVYDLVVCNLGIGEMTDPAAAIADFTRVTKPGGEVRCTLPLEGTFQEFFDIYREVLTKNDKHETLAALTEHIETSYPGVATCEHWLRKAGLTDIKVEVERFTMLFRSSREFFFAPVIEFGPLPEWKALAGQGQEMQDVFWYIKEAIDAYFENRAFEITVVAGSLVGKKPERGSAEELQAVAEVADSQEFEVDADDVTGEQSLDSLETTDPRGDRPRLITEPNDDGIGELDRLDSELGDLADDIGDLADGIGELSDPADVALDAFVDGTPRPDHLDDD